MTSASGTIIDGEAYARLRTGGEAPRLEWSPVAADFLPVGASSETAGPAPVIGFEAGDFVNLDDFEKRALDVLPHMARTYYVSGAEDETTLRENRQAFSRWFLRPRVLRDVSSVDTSTTLLNGSVKVSMPILAAPTAMHRLAHPDGELATITGAHAAGTLMTLSSLATTRVEDVAAARRSPSDPLWLQLYVFKDRSITESFVKRAEASGCTAIVVTVDTPFLGRREEDIRNQFHLPEGLSLRNFEDVFAERMTQVEGASGLNEYVAEQFDSALTWDDIAWLRTVTDLPILVKGVVTAEDAEIACEYGVDGIVVSNHGGRQLDYTLATIDALPEVVEAVDGRCEVYLDGGVRRGTDVVKALALGATAVFLGRPVLWSLASGGADGVAHMFDLIRRELELDMALCGCTSVDQISRKHVARPPHLVSRL